MIYAARGLFQIECKGDCGADVHVEVWGDQMRDIEEAVEEAASLPPHHWIEGWCPECAQQAAKEEQAEFRNKQMKEDRL